LDFSPDLSPFLPDLDLMDLDLDWDLKLTDLHLYLDLEFLIASPFSSPLNAATEDSRTLYKKMLPSLSICLIG